MKHRKEQLIQGIQSLESESDIEKMEKELEQINARNYRIESLKVDLVSDVSIDELEEQQGYKMRSIRDLLAPFEGLEWEESLEDMLKKLD